MSVESEPPGVGEPPPTNTPSSFDLDARPVVHARSTPPPVMGGTLLALSDARRVLISDPDRDRIWLVDYLHRQFQGPIQLEAAALPARAVEDKSGHAHVILRGTGEVASIDLASASVSERRHVCSAPRGIALAPSGDRLFVACAEGRLIELPLSGPALGEQRIPLDARDVVFQKDRLFVSRFRSSELLELDANRSVSKRVVLPSVSGLVPSDPFSGSQNGLLEPAVAWRTVAMPDGSGVVMVHQHATVTEIDLPHPEQGAGVGTGRPGSSAYGGDGSGCGGIVQSAVTVVKDGVAMTSPQLAGVVLPVDVAVSTDGFVAVAGAGSFDVNGLLKGFSPSANQALSVFDASRIDRSQTSCLQALNTSAVTSPVVAVAFEPTAGGRVLALSRQPMRLLALNFRSGLPTLESFLDIDTESSEDTGHELFHRDAGQGIACASCHPEGTDDGRTWKFSPIGERRTQPIDIGLADTAPFHWDGDLPDIGSLMNEVFVRRMGGASQSVQRVGALQDWVFGLRPRVALRPASDSAAERGQALFKSSEVGCTACHSGEKFTNSKTFDVGTGGKFQVPSLLGVGQRVPVMHNGCARTLRDRFDASCGGTAHGNTAQLDESQLDDLVAYLESI